MSACYRVWFDCVVVVIDWKPFMLIWWFDFYTMKFMFWWKSNDVIATVNRMCISLTV